MKREAREVSDLEERGKNGKSGDLYPQAETWSRETPPRSEAGHQSKALPWRSSSGGWMYDQCPRDPKRETHVQKEMY